jgi:hypothetical protein
MRRNLIIVVGFLAVAAGLFFTARSAMRKRTAPEPTLPGAVAPVVAPAAPRLAPPPPPRAPGQQVAATVLDEGELMRQLRPLVRNHPPRAEAMAREARQRFGDSADSDERDALLVNALINQQHIGAARDEALYYFAHHPKGKFAQQVFTMTGVHPQIKRP